MSVASKLPVQRVLSQTPLAKRYEQAVLGVDKTRKRIPWERFERSLYPEAALALAEDAATRLAEGEYYAVGLFGRIASGVAMARAPFDIVQAVASVSTDEVRHADYCTRFATLCGGKEATLSIDPGALDASTPALPTQHDTDFLIAKYAATGETLAAALLAECRRRAKDPVARALFSSLLADEVHHAKIGWCYLAWRAPLWTLAERQAIADQLGEFIQDIERSLWTGRDAPPSARAAADALGVLDSVSQREVVRRVMEEEIVPGHDALGLGASHAYAARPAISVIQGLPPGFVFVRTSSVAKSDEELDAPPTLDGAIDRAATWLGGCVADSGNVPFSVDALTDVVTPFGPFRHGRTALVVQALGEHSASSEVAARARATLESEVRRALAGDTVADWPGEPALVASTLALATLAGIDVRESLVAVLTDAAPLLDSWSAAQVATALGADAPESVWKCAVTTLEKEPWAPWTARAARARGDSSVLRRAERALAAAVRTDGSVWGLDCPEIPRTAATVESLSPFDTQIAFDAARRASDFLLSVQLALPSARGAFPLMPHGRQLRLDATAHALAALIAWRRVAGGRSAPSTSS